MILLLKVWLDAVLIKGTVKLSTPVTLLSDVELMARHGGNKCTTSKTNLYYCNLLPDLFQTTVIIAVSNNN